MAISQSEFNHHGNHYLVMFEDWRTRAGRHTITWSLRPTINGEQTLGATGHYANGKGYYSIDRMVPDWPSKKLIQLAFRHRKSAVEIEMNGGCSCRYESATKIWHRCKECLEFQANNKETREGVARRTHLFDDISEIDRPTGNGKRARNYKTTKKVILALNSASFAATPAPRFPLSYRSVLLMSLWCKNARTCSNGTKASNKVVAAALLN